MCGALEHLAAFCARTFLSFITTIMDQKVQVLKPVNSEGGRIENIWQPFPLSYIVYECTPVLPTLGQIYRSIFRFCYVVFNSHMFNATDVQL
jgi:hypothetical protein